MTEPADFDPETTPAMSLCGKSWPVPELVWRDLKRCRSAIIELNGRLNDAIAAAPELPGATEAERVARNMGILGDVFDGLSDEDCDRLVVTVIHAGLNAAHPSITRSEFEGWRLTERDRQMAWLVVRRQSGLFVFQGDEAPSPGEADGAA